MKKMIRKTVIALAAVLLMLTFTGTCFAYTETPWWYPEDVYGFVDFHDPAAPKVVDAAGIFTDAEKAELTAQIENIVEKHGADLVIYTDTTRYGEDEKMVAADFYQFNGYGVGDDYNGTCFFLQVSGGHGGWATVACGACREYYTEANINKIDDKIMPDIKNGNYYNAMKTYLTLVDGLYTKGHLPKTAADIGFRAVAGLIVGVILAAIVVAALTKSMKKVAAATQAENYMVRDSFNLALSNDIFLYAHTTRVKRDSGGGGGRSSFSGGFSSSGGRGFSGGGRRF